MLYPARANLSAAALAALMACACNAGAQTPDPRQDLDARQLELRGAQDTLKASENQRRALEAELELLRNDRARLAAALIETTARAREAEAMIEATERRLDTAMASENAIKASLESRRGLIAEVLAALQRLGRKPPPAVLVAPRDMLRAVRSAMLLSAVLPELRAETQTLAADLADLVNIRQNILAEREKFGRESSALASERGRLSSLVETRQKTLVETEQALAAERQRGQEIARQATDLRDLVARMEGDMASARNAAETARRAEEARKAEEARLKAADAPLVRLAMGPFRDPARLAPAIPFAQAKGMLPMPAAGTIAKPFGAADGYGGAEKGISIAVRPRAVVASPTDGTIKFSGPYRSWGHLLIIDAGGGYYVILAGMEKVNVDIRQFVLAGEPVGEMGDANVRTAAAIALGATHPLLYVEFRKDGASIDPAPWWAKPEQEKVRG